MVAYVVLNLIVWDSSTGLMLEEYHGAPVGFSVSGDKIEDCRKYGVDRGYKLTAKWRANGHPYAFTNVDCEWHQNLGEPT